MMEIAYSSELNRLDDPKTKTYIYALPMLDEKRSRFVNIQNCFLRNVDYPDYDHHLFSVFREEEKESYKEMVYKLRMASTYNFDHMFDDIHRSFCFSPPKKFESDFIKFKESKYSEMSDEYKDRILSFHGFAVKGNIARLLYRDEKEFLKKEEEFQVSIPRDNEIISVLNPNKETLTHDLKVNYEYKESTDTT